jgi:hypothetical protein
MSSQFLSAFIENAAFDISLHVAALKGGKLDWVGLQQLCKAFRQRGVCSLLLNGESDAYFVNTMQSASACLYFSRQMHDEKRCLSQIEPIFDAICGGYWECARELAVLSPKAANLDYEYEDDYLYAKFLLEVSLIGAADETSRNTLDRYEVVSEGIDSPRLEVGRALLDHDEEAFHTNLYILLDDSAEKLEAKIDRNAMPEEEWSWQRYFSTEGLALIRIAMRRNIPVAADYPHVPEELIYGKSLPFDQEVWKRA